MLRNRIVPGCLILALLLGGAHQTAAQAIGFRSLSNYLTAQHFDQIKLRRRFGNHLYLSAQINNRPAALLIDSAAPSTLIHRDSAADFGLTLTGSSGRYADVFGDTEGTAARGWIRTLQLGRQVLNDVPVTIANQAAWVDPPEYMIIPKLKPNARRAKFKYYAKIDPVNGLLGLDLLQKYGAVLDCGHQMLYLNPGGPNPTLSHRLGAILMDRGFAEVPIHLTRDHRLEVESAINGRPTRLIVDTGSSFTLFNTQVGYDAGVSAAPSRLVYVINNFHLVQLRDARVKNLAVGNFKIDDAAVCMAQLSSEALHANYSDESNAGLLGMEQLSINYGVIDFGSMTLYLRHPDRR